MRRLKVGDDLVEMLVLFRTCFDLLGKIVVSMVNLGEGLTEVLLHVLAKVGQGGLHGCLHGCLHHAHEFFCHILLGLVVKGHLLSCGTARWAGFVGGFGGSGDVVACVLFGAGSCFGRGIVVGIE